MSSEKLPELSVLEGTLLIAFVEFADTNALTRIDEANIHTNTSDFKIRPLMLKPTFYNLCEKGILQKVHEEYATYYELNPTYADQIDSFISLWASTNEDQTKVVIPAADRFVSTKDNQIDTSQAVAALDELTEAIRTSNDLTANSEDKLQISREISFLKEVIEQPRLHIAALYDAKVNTTLRWLTEQAFSAIVRQAAVRVMQNLDKLWEIVKPHL